MIIANTCEAWTCRACGERKAKQLAQIAAAAKPNRLITLTINPNLHANPRDAYDTTRRQIPTLTQKLRRKFGELEYLRVLEVTKKGWPHYHLVARCGYIPQQTISQEWDVLTGAPIVDIRKIRQSREVYWYVVKYLAKQHYIEWTQRRVTMTRHFNQSPKWKPETPLDLIGFSHETTHPEAYLALSHPQTRWQQLGATIWAYDGKLTETERRHLDNQAETAAEAVSA